MINKVILCGIIGEYGVRLSYTEAGKPQLSFTLVCAETTKTGEYKSFIPCLVVGVHAEALAEQLEPHDLILLEGKLAFKAGKTKDAGKLVVTTFAVQRLQTAATVMP